MEKIKHTMQQLKAGAAAIAAAYDLDIVTASKIIGYYNVGAVAGVKYNDGDPEKLAAILSGDLSSVPAAAAVIGITLHESVNPGSTSAASDHQKNAGSNIKNFVSRKEKTTKQSAHTSPEPKAKKEKKEGKTNGTGGGVESPNERREKMRRLGALGVAAKKKKIKELEKDRGGNIETVTGDIVADTPAGVLPDNVAALIMDVIQSYCDQNNITDLSKERQPRWGAACYMVGVSVFKPSKILHDIQREKTNGGIVYDVGRVSALVDLWGVLCQNFCKAPLIDDFTRFAGLSDTWIYGSNMPDGLTPARSALLQKIKRIQESGLSGLIVDGRQNPTGALAALNHWHGWTQTREIIHTSGAASVSAPSLPVFDVSGGFLEDKSGENST